MGKPKDDVEESGGSEEESEDEMEVELDLDEQGRVRGTSECGLNFGFTAQMCELKGKEGTAKSKENERDSKSHAKKRKGNSSATSVLEALRADCDTIFGNEDSFWLPATMEPRCTMERLAREVFAYHTRNVKEYDEHKSGAEWWVQSRPAGLETSSIGFHWDKDEDLVDSCNVAVHPQISTVTYLSSCGAPTMVCDRRAPVNCEDTEDLYSEERDFTTAHLSYPRCQAGDRVLVKHISFDGQLLHGAPADMAKAVRDGEGDGSQDGETRRTFLVNIWLQHVPIGLEPLPEEALDAVSDLAVSLPLLEAEECARAKVAGSGREEERAAARFGPTGRCFGPHPYKSLGAGSEHELSFGRIAWEGSSACTLDVDLGAPGAEGRLREAPRERLAAVPSCEAAEATWSTVAELYAKYQVLLVKGGARPRCSGGGSERSAAGGTRKRKARGEGGEAEAGSEREGGARGLLGMAELRELYGVDCEAIRKTWNVENGEAAELTAQKVLGGGAGGAEAGGGTGAQKKAKGHAGKAGKGGAGAGGAGGGGGGAGEEGWYVSFVLNRSAGLEHAMKLLPVAVPSFLQAKEDEADEEEEELEEEFGVEHTDNVWFFVGRNTSGQPLRGRAEHTDKISHSGTWHAQQEGSKVWYIRPNHEGEWPAWGSPLTADEEPLRVEVAAGDLIMINTALWYHRTELPSTKAALEQLSFSYARDFYIGRSSMADGEVEMDNLDDTWATDDIPRGTVVAEGSVALSFPRAAAGEPVNCIVERGRRGGGCRVLAGRDIREGESLRVAAAEEAEEAGEVEE